MDIFRLMLLVIGLVIVAGVFWWTRRTLDRSQPRREERLDSHMSGGDPLIEDDLPPLRPEEEAVPKMNTGSRGDEGDDEPPMQSLDPEPPAEPVSRRVAAPEPASQPEPEPEPDPEPEPAGPVASLSEEFSGRTLLLVLYVVAREGRLKGSELRAAFAASGLRFGPMNLFHRMDGNRSRFSVANVLEPGQFDRDNMDHLETPAIVLYLRLPTAGDAHEDLNEMVLCARDLANQLGAEVRDERRSVLTKQTVEHMHDQIREFQRAQRIPQSPERRR